MFSSVKQLSLGARLTISMILMVTITCLACVGVAWRIASDWISNDAAATSSRQSDFVLRQIAIIDQLSGDEVGIGMRTLREEGRLKGAPSLNGTAMLAGRSVPNLCLGTESQVSNFSIVDEVKRLAGGTATLFAWDGANFIRISTNVLTPDGSRAIGTVLDPGGKAYAALIQQRAFGGVVNILGVPYITSYVPMLDADGKLVGAWYTGYRLDSIIALGKSIEDTPILDHGFVALLTSSGTALFHGKQVSDTRVEQLLDNSKGWIVHRETYPAWGYTVLTAYPASDVLRLKLTILSLPAAGTVAMVCLILLLQLVLLRRLVLRPVGELTRHLATADLNTLIPTGRNDEIGALAINFNQYVLRLRQMLIRVRDGSQATTGKSGEIRGISEGAVARMQAQSARAENAAEAVEKLSQEITGISRHTQDASQRAREAAEAASKGAKLVASSVTLIQDLSTDTQQSAGRVASLSERAEQIGSIVEMIDEIAAGTNLLALNASIEAARAGEHGRGFAVVAGEVRRLAERTAQATHQVAALVDGIKSETAQTAQGIRSACERATQGAETVSSLSDAFQHIASLVVEVNGRVEQIADSARQEAVAADAVLGTMHDVSATAQENAHGAEQIVAASGELLATASGLEGMVEEFHLTELPEGRAA